MENNTLDWPFGRRVTSGCVYVSHGRSAEDGYFRRRPGPPRPLTAENWTDAPEKNKSEAPKKNLILFQVKIRTNKNLWFCFQIKAKRNKVVDLCSKIESHILHQQPFHSSPSLHPLPPPPAAPFALQHSALPSPPKV